MDKPIKSQVHLVTPAIPSSPGWNYELTNLDLINWIPRPEYHELVFFFRDCVSPHHGERELHQGLKSSLSKALAEFPVLAGRICHGEAPFKLKVNVNSQGVNVIESRSDASLDEWSDLRQCPISVDFSLSGDHADLSQMPLMQVQVTTFRCGGVAIGFHFLHMVMDGYSLVKFLTRWSEIHRGVSPVNPRNRQDFTTAVLKARSSPLVDAPVPFVVEHAQQDALGFDFGGAEEHESMVLRMGKQAIDSCAREIESSTKFG
ncbi:shikimate O-hydroxycinnamoyltransferase [Selaginella moellendorffii]|uniref:shikimate O-hydroxycinnamoyltransferase n=1 Tax=Selaginella moellendorffii TaxID=88036 RepID=UPI000D1C5B43|nr:shikimate O-hydroxycinnamoyltransferase [Selaginella moellendorffii]|eukprot:XP_024541440.1 shikimate O-hydroxycinnamoyltransferase [Selaginella moellendorffii]